MSKSNKYWLVLFLSPIAFFFLINLRVGAEPTPEQLRAEAEAAKREAMLADCTTIGNRTAKCYSGIKGECEQLRESIAWFRNQYNGNAALLCPAQELLN